VDGLLAPATELVREQLRSPGQRLLALRTVDRRSGRRVRGRASLALFALASGGVFARRRFTPVDTPAHARERERVRAEADAIYRRHPDDVDARQRELSALFEGSDTPNVMVAVLPSLVAGVAGALLRRRIAPTVEISAERGLITARRSARSRRA